MASSSALWVRGLARLTSSANSSCVKIGPLRNSNCCCVRSNTDTPMMSAGRRSLVNCTRCQASPNRCASACASVVLPTPGTSSISKCPRASKHASDSLSTSGFPRIASPNTDSTSTSFERGTGGVYKESRTSNHDIQVRYHSRVGDIAWVPSSAAAVPAIAAPARHSARVRVTHWIATLCFFALLVSGIEILISHPRFYWGEAGNINMEPLFKIPIPSSRALVRTGYGYVLPDQNGWSRYLHFQAAWIVVLTGILYILYSLFTGHLQKNLFPRKTDFSWRVFSSEIASHVRFARPPAEEAWSYNPLQRIAYLFVILILFPLVIWTGLAMSPAFVSAVPAAVTAFGG